MYKTITQCRSCSASWGHLTHLFSIGEQYVSDFSPTREDAYKGNKVPIDIYQCSRCTLIQQLHTAPQDFLYSRHYWYQSGLTKLMRDALLDIVQSALNHVSLKPNDIVLDIGSNDGTLLRAYSLYYSDIIKVGVEPALNLKERGSEGVEIFINDFWNIDAYREDITKSKYNDLNILGSFKAKVITAIGMFYDLDDPNKFISDISKALHPEGIFIAQLMCAKQMYNLGDVGNLAHEHLEFYTYESLRQLLGRHGLMIIDIEENTINGGSYRFYIKHEGATIDERAQRRIDKEYNANIELSDKETWKLFYERIKRNKEQVCNYIKNEHDKGANIWILGASTKGNVLLQWYELDDVLISGASDKSSEKDGKYTIGTGIPIHKEEIARTYNPSHFLILPYAFSQEFIQRESAALDRGCKFIVPLPELKIIQNKKL